VVKGYLVSFHFTHHRLSTSETDDFLFYFSRIEPIKVDPCGMVFFKREAASVEHVRCGRDWRLSFCKAPGRKKRGKGK
jgi:hypothetical protein